MEIPIYKVHVGIQNTNRCRYVHTVTATEYQAYRAQNLSFLYILYFKYVLRRLNCQLLLPDYVRPRDRNMYLETLWTMAVKV